MKPPGEPEETYERAKEILLQLLEVGSEERAPILERLCGSDVHIRADVESLLQASERSGLEHPIEASHVEALLGERVAGIPGPERLLGRRLGSFSLQSTLGSGGMGFVFEARQENPSRLVALKILRTPSSAELVKRFRNEATLLARVRHPGIAQVYEAGTFEEGGYELPWFAMELIPGARSITEFAASRGLDRKQRVELLAQACDALASAHMAGIVHRDIKPANLIVGDDGRVKVIDFGVARTEEAAQLLTSHQTLPGLLLGTLRYMSPEQLDGKADKRSDVYALGLVLYELLCARFPYDVDGLGVSATALVIREKPPLRPRAFDGGLHKDMEAVLLQALEKDPSARYQSASELAADLHRFLAGLRVLARTPNAWEVAMRWAARHPVPFTVAACVVLATVSLLSTWLGISFLGWRPARIVLDDEERSITLLSRMGHELYSWDSKKPQGIVFSGRIDRPKTLGGGHVAVIGYERRALDCPFAGELCFYDFEQPEQPFWTSRDEQIPLPPGVAARPEAHFVLEHALIADVIGESPGPEIVATFVWDPYSQEAIRVFDARGRLRYQAWQDGGICSLYWMADSRRLIISGFNSEAQWDQRGTDTKGSAARYPAIVFALDIADGHVSNSWLVEGGRRLDETLAWYKWIGPAEWVYVFDDGFPPLQPAIGESMKDELTVLRWVQQRGLARPPYAELFFVLDAEGRVVRSYEADGYKLGYRHGRLPPSSTFRLFDYEELPKGTNLEASQPR